MGKGGKKGKGGRREQEEAPAETTAPVETLDDVASEEPTVDPRYPLNVALCPSLFSLLLLFFFFERSCV